MDVIIPTKLIEKKSIEKIKSKLEHDFKTKSNIIVYQHPIETINEEFKKYCIENKNVIRESKILISLPISYVQQNIESIQDLIKSFIKSLNGLGFNLNEKIELIPNTDIDKALQNKISKSFDQTDESDIYITIFKISELIEKSTLNRSTLEMALGLIAVPLGVIVFYLGIVKYNTPPAFGTSLLMIGGGAILLYIGMANRKYQKWLKDN